MANLASLREDNFKNHFSSEQEVLEALLKQADITTDFRKNVSARAEELVETLRQSSRPGLMEVFLAEYGLSSQEGISLMCLAEALLRVPDQTTIDELIEDKVAASSWSAHLGQSSSPLVNASTWALMLTGSVLSEEKDGIANVLRGAVRRLGEPVIRTAITQAMRELGRQFVLGRDIDEAMTRAASMEAKGFAYSYDMLGEAALTNQDANGFFKAYAAAISAISANCDADLVKDNPGISVKLSALHPRYEMAQRDRVMSELVPLVKALAIMAKTAQMGFNIDAEEADRLELSLDVIEAVLADPALEGWDGFGVVIQAYGKRASATIDWVYALAKSLGRRIMIRLVKGAYWDAEIKLAQVEGLSDFSVFTRKTATDVSYICCAQKLLQMTDHIYPQFATHNAHTVSAILEMANDRSSFEFQRLHGMGEGLHQTILEAEKTRCRIYAPVGAHRDLLAYLVRRLLENGANSSFVNQIVDETVSAKTIAADPFEALETDLSGHNPNVVRPSDLYAPTRKNAAGWDLSDVVDIKRFDEVRNVFVEHKWHVKPITVHQSTAETVLTITSPSDPNDVVGSVVEANEVDVEAAISAARPWGDCEASRRTKILTDAAELFEKNSGEIFAALAREAGKTPNDAVSELREAVDFMRYYASEALTHGNKTPCGLFSCISPWNFPLAIFTGQIAAALAAGNGVLAKPAESTPIAASIAVKLLHEAGVPRETLQLLPGRGNTIGRLLTQDKRVNGVCFTGSTQTAKHIDTSMAEHIAPWAPLIAETGGLNAMIVDSTALPQQAVSDIISSAFQSAGQRCSALRLLYLQEDVAPAILNMLFGAMDELHLGNPWQLATDVGPTISAEAANEINAYIQQAQQAGRLLKQLDKPTDGHFVAPAVIKIDGIAALEKEIFGPVLHVATLRADQIDEVIDAVNAKGFGLTFGLHTRIDDRVEHVTSRLKAGNIYINRNQIGAVVGSQPFGGEGLSGTGPKAGGPNYLKRFYQQENPQTKLEDVTVIEPYKVQSALDALPDLKLNAQQVTNLPGPTGETNRLSLYPRGKVLCLGPSQLEARQQAELATACGCASLMVVSGMQDTGHLDGFLLRSDLTQLEGFDAVILWSEKTDMEAARQALAVRSGPIIPLIASKNVEERCILERHICVDTTAAGGNASLLAVSS